MSNLLICGRRVLIRGGVIFAGAVAIASTVGVAQETDLSEREFHEFAPMWGNPKDELTDMKQEAMEFLWCLAQIEKPTRAENETQAVVLLFTGDVSGNRFKTINGDVIATFLEKRRLNYRFPESRVCAMYVFGCDNWDSPAKLIPLAREGLNDSSAEVRKFACEALRQGTYALTERREDLANKADLASIAAQREEWLDQMMDLAAKGLCDEDEEVRREARFIVDRVAKYGANRARLRSLERVGEMRALPGHSHYDSCDHVVKAMRQELANAEAARRERIRQATELDEPPEP